MAKEMGLEKSRRVDKTPFQTGPSGYQQSQTGGSGRGRTFNSSNEQSKWFPKSGFKPEKRKPAGLKKRRYVSCKQLSNFFIGRRSVSKVKNIALNVHQIVKDLNFVMAEKRRECQANSQLEGFKQKCEISTFQNGRVPNGKKSPKKGGLDGQAGLKRSVYMSTGVKIASKISALSTWSKDVPISNTSVRPGVRPKNIHKSNETHCCTNEAHRHADSNLFGHILILNQSKHGLVKDQNTLVWTLHCLGWIINWSKSVTEPSQTIEFLGMIIDSMEAKCKAIVQKCKHMLESLQVSIHDLASLIGTLNATAEAVIPASLYVREPTNVQNKEFIENDTIPVAYNTNARMQERDEMVALHLEKWNGKCIISPNPDLIIESDASSKQGLGAVDVAQNIRMGGPWDETEKGFAYKCSRIKSRRIRFKVLNKRQNRHSCSFKNGQCVRCSAYKQHGRDTIPNFTKNKSRDMGILPTKGNNSNSRIHSGGSKRNCGLGKSSHRKFKQLDSEQGNISTDQQNNGSVEIRSVRRSPERTIGQLCQLETRSICDPNRCVSSELVEQEPICFFPVLLDSSLSSESEQRTLESSYHNSSLAVISVLPNAIGNVNISTNTAPSNERFIDKPTGRDPPTNRKQNLKTSGVGKFPD
ncbi:Hypothetical predicted protein [Mytilus galloprovincialis]|uniref:Uncharacterized protein n=1 Tax=Mytilus galloprovincialis TaxID=29158 RepID=A0A8B6E324_MYTGA|nr:Hypothetical predicted protein [Mytilus galloprovincialis]